MKRIKSLFKLLKESFRHLVLILNSFIILSCSSSLEIYKVPNLKNYHLAGDVEIYIFWQPGGSDSNIYISKERINKNFESLVHQPISIDIFQKETPDLYLIATGELVTNDPLDLVKIARENNANAILISSMSGAREVIVKRERTISENKYSGTKMVHISYHKGIEYRYYFKLYRIETLIPEKYRLTQEQREIIAKELEQNKTKTCDKSGPAEEKTGENQLIYYNCINGKRHGFFIEIEKGKEYTYIVNQGSYKDGKIHGRDYSGNYYHEGDLVNNFFYLKTFINPIFYNANIQCKVEGENRSSTYTNEENTTKIDYTYYCNNGKKEGKLTGYIKIYLCKDGQEGTSTNYCNSHKGVKEIYSRPYLTVNFKNDLENGEAIKEENIYGKKIKILYNYKNGLLDGESIYYENDQIKEKTVFKDNEIVLQEKYISPKTVERIVFKYFKPVSKETINY